MDGACRLFCSSCLVIACVAEPSHLQEGSGTVTDTQFSTVAVCIEWHKKKKHTRWDCFDV